MPTSDPHSSFYANYFVVYPLSVIFIAYSFSLISQKVPYQFIDEIFHIPQAQQYCNSNFSFWDPKITTPPGLYYIAYIYYTALNWVSKEKCSLDTLRSLNTIGGTVIFPVVALIPLNRKYPQRFWLSSIILLPILFFYLGLFYTDAWSTILILSSFSVSYLLPFGFQASSITAAFLAFLSLWLRQTNIIWSAFNLVIVLSKKSPAYPYYQSRYSVFRVYTAVTDFAKTTFTNFNLVLPFAVNFVLFAVFLIHNGGITFGDKLNHVSTIHLPQVFYCLAFMTFFSWPLTLSLQKVKSYFNAAFGSIQKFLVTLTVYVAMYFAIKHFTIAHPFLLADNRHYTFYIWRKIINYNQYSRYALIPMYHFSGYLILAPLLEGSGLIVTFAYIFCVTASIVPSPLFEPRYYILPYFYWRLLVNPSNQPVVPFLKSNPIFQRLSLEFLWSLLVDLILLTVFIQYKFTWETETEPQRIIW